MRRLVDDVSGRLHGMWASVAPAWADKADLTDRNRSTLTEQMLARTMPRPGERVLELACGPGGLGLAAAELVAPDGDVVLSDVVAEMTAIAAARAESLGVRNVITLELDLEAISEPDASYDVVLCRDGLMFVLDPACAAREIRRVLRPDGRFALTAWGGRARNPWLSVVFDVVGAQLGRAVPPPGFPGPFSLGDANALAALLTAAALSDVDVTETPAPMTFGSFEEWWGTTSALAGPLASILAALPEDATRALRARAQKAVDPYQTPDGLEFPGVTLLASGRGTSS